MTTCPRQSIPPYPTLRIISLSPSSPVALATGVGMGAVTPPSEEQGLPKLGRMDALQCALMVRLVRVLVCFQMEGNGGGILVRHKPTHRFLLPEALRLEIRVHRALEALKRLVTFGLAIHLINPSLRCLDIIEVTTKCELTGLREWH